VPPWRERDSVRPDERPDAPKKTRLLKAGRVGWQTETGVRFDARNVLLRVAGKLSMSYISG
jgi:hypothetical protein